MGRPINQTEHFSWIKKKLQHLGSWAVRMASKTSVADAPSGFRALSRETAIRLNVFTPYTYTLETIIQAGQSNLRVLSVPVRTNEDLRPSRLVRSISSYVRRSLATIFRVFIIYRPLSFFLWTAAAMAVPGVLIGARFLYHFSHGDGDGHIQSLILASLLMMLSALASMCGFIADLVATNRKLLERIDQRLQHLQYRSH